MRLRFIPGLFASALRVSLSAPLLVAQGAAPRIDHHQHLFSLAVARLRDSTATAPRFPAESLIALLDSARIRGAVVLSVAYLFGSPSRVFEDEYSTVRAENDWTADQASRYPGRLVAVCSFNPLKSYALAELTRCAADPRLRVGIKLHFGNSDVQLDDFLHVAQLQRVFRAANSHRMAIILHLRASVSRNRPYGPAQARIFLEQVLPAAPDVPIQIAHLAGTGPGYRDPGADSVMTTLAEAVATHQPASRNLWFDVATSADTSLTPASAAQIVQRIRRVGASRILYGSDAPLGGNLAPREGWAAFTRLPLTPAELDTIGHNVAPYLLMDSAGVHAR